MEGVIEHIYRRQEEAMIRGDDGLQLPFRKSALNGVEFLGLCSGQRVSYLIQEGWLRQGGCERPPVVSGSISWKWRLEWLGRFP